MTIEEKYMKKLTPKEYLVNCTDQELFEIVNGIEQEIEKRLIALFKSHNCTVVCVSKDEGISANVNDIYGCHKWDSDDEHFDKWVDVVEIGYGTVLDKDKIPLDYLFVITDKCEEFSNDEINGECLWDLYKAVKDVFEKNE